MIEKQKRIDKGRQGKVKEIQSGNLGTKFGLTHKWKCMITKRSHDGQKT